MTMKKILAAVAATAIAGSAMATMAFAADVIDFENGSFDGIEMNIDEGADSSVLSIADFNGSKALKIDVQDCSLVPKVKMNLTKLVPADKLDEILKITFDATIEAKDGVTPPGWGGGAIGTQGTDAPAWNQTDWTLEEYTNPVSATATLERALLPIPGELFVDADEGAHVMFMRWGTEVPYNMYIDNIKFLDKDGNAIEVTVADAPAADTPAAGGTDTSAPAGGANTGVAPVAAIALTTLAGAALIASKKR